ncbi:hypothetical protein AC26_3348 [Escherichia coli 1-176-05_S3_C2]|nr:hypothetical protein AC26_3348 [Escherichia coli 1-176-05_S3_C2]
MFRFRRPDKAFTPHPAFSFVCRMKHLRRSDNNRLMRR